MATETMTRGGFKRGWLLAQNMHLDKIRNEIFEGLDLKSNQMWYNRLNGIGPISPVEADFVETVFEKYGVSKDDIWDAE